MKGKILVLSLAVIAFSITGSIVTVSFFTDSDSSTASFTVGKVKIRTITSSTGRYDASHTYSDEEIIQNFSEYSSFLEDKCTNLLATETKPASCPRNIFIQNTGTVPVYARIIVQIPREVYIEDIDIAYGGSKEYEVSESNGYVTCFNGKGRCYEYIFTRFSPLEAGRMTTNPSMTAMTYTGIAQANTDESGEEGSSEGINLANQGIKVYVQAIQSFGFESAAEAFNNYQ